MYDSPLEKLADFLDKFDPLDPRQTLDHSDPGAYTLWFQGVLIPLVRLYGQGPTPNIMTFQLTRTSGTPGEGIAVSIDPWAPRIYLRRDTRGWSLMQKSEQTNRWRSVHPNQFRVWDGWGWLDRRTPEKD